MTISLFRIAGSRDCSRLGVERGSRDQMQISLRHMLAEVTFHYTRPFDEPCSEKQS